MLSSDLVEKMEQARDILESNLQDPPPIAELAHRVGMSETYLKTNFKISFGCTVGGFVLTQRMELAKKLFRQGDMNVSEIAREVGYKHTTHFSAAFKKATGMSPKVFARLGQAAMALLVQVSTLGLLEPRSAGVLLSIC